MRKRTWYACVVIDRNLSMTYGRPPSIPESFVKLPPPNSCDPTETATNDVLAQNNMMKCLSLGFFNATIFLYRIMSDVIETLYGQNIGDNESDTIVSILGRCWVQLMLVMLLRKRG